MLMVGQDGGLLFAVPPGSVLHKVLYHLKIQEVPAPLHPWPFCRVAFDEQ